VLKKSRCTWQRSEHERLLLGYPPWSTLH